VIDGALGAARSAIEVGNYALMASLVRAGFGPTIAPASAMSGDTLAGLHAIPAEDSRLRWTLSAAVCADRRVTAAAEALLDALIEGAGRCAGEAGYAAARELTP
jgi:DNA-binding transcriptional LysR family regulator